MNSTISDIIAFMCLSNYASAEGVAAICHLQMMLIYSFRLISSAMLLFLRIKVVENLRWGPSNL